MKNLFLAFFVAFIFSGCSKEYALQNFDLSTHREASEISFESRKLLNDDGSVAIMLSCLYLNDVYKDAFGGDEYFYISLYAKDSDVYLSAALNGEDEIEDLESLGIKLNSTLPIKIIQLPRENDFSKLLDINNNWSKNYVVIFKESENLKLDLSFSYKDKKANVLYDKDY